MAEQNWHARSSDGSLTPVLIHVDPARFEDKPLVLKRADPDDYHVLADGLLAGRIFKTNRGAMDTIWVWSLTGPWCGEPDCPAVSYGDTVELEEAKAQIKAAFEAWLAWAKVATARGEKIAWHG